MTNKKYKIIKDFDSHSVEDMGREDLLNEIKNCVIQKLYELKEKGEFVEYKDPFPIEIEPDPNEPGAVIVKHSYPEIRTVYHLEVVLENTSSQTYQEFEDYIIEENK